MKILKFIFRSFIYLFILTLIPVGAFFYWAVGESLPKRAKIDIVEHDNIPNQPFKEEISVISYNIGHGQGVKVNPWDHKDENTTKKQLDELVKVIKNINADIYALQEVDLDSNRTQHINEIEYIKNKTGYPFHACAIVWQKNYVPFPYFPIKDHIGYVRAANCVLSKYRLSNQHRIVFNKPKNNPWWYNLGYLDYAIQRVDVNIGQEIITVLNVHLDAFNISSREEQIKVLSEYIKEISLPIIILGDFNTIPPKDPIKKGFQDEPELNFSTENTFSWFFSNQPQLKIPKIENVYTYPSNKPTRRLDHIFLLSDKLNFINFTVVEEAGTASDHLPVKAVISIKP